MITQQKETERILKIDRLCYGQDKKRPALKTRLIDIAAFNALILLNNNFSAQGMSLVSKRGQQQITATFKMGQKEMQ